MKTSSTEQLSSPAMTVPARVHEHQAFLLRRFGFVVAPILAGLDKFTDLLVNWDQYLCPSPTGSSAATTTAS